MLPKDSRNEPKENLKLIYKIRNEEKNISEDKRVVTKILKMDENNQYRNAMTKPLPIGSIKNSIKVPSMREFQNFKEFWMKIRLFIFLLSILNLTQKIPAKNNYFSTKFIHQFLRKKGFVSK